ncbi:hypothetical protein EIL87_18330 [Saccharopolyspora rhizosphaerae]|uniref:Uncharacterized protein n=1 Tax=Saccharopolyspora rhizosphaerae TaxID=2492662 RepID=A0A426JNP6_9PSEU|nr:DUF5955 family protein [Saccharopolyspora rhizosphaerae]RRO14705.1 hypothetical protein EIL87_18330 [Saccharopolyspora rhizosphaerae]
MNNYGINVSGSGQFNADAVAVGPGARAVSHGNAQQVRELQRQVEQLLGELRAARADGRLEDDEVVRDAEALADAADGENPDQGRISRLLSGISSSVGQVGELATAVTNVQGAVSSLFG